MEEERRDKEGRKREDYAGLKLCTFPTYICI
jgi:hypothetical protein